MSEARDDAWGAIERTLDGYDVAYAAGVTDSIMDALEDEGLMIVKSNEKKLNPAQVRAIRSKHRLGDTQAELADFYGVNPATVSRIVRGEYW